MLEASIFQSGSFLSALGSIGLILISHVANKYVIPYLKTGKKRRYAEFIAMIADEVTDDLRQRYPEKEWLKHIDEAIDSLISICDIDSEIAERAINAAVARRR